VSAPLYRIQPARYGLAEVVDDDGATRWVGPAEEAVAEAERATAATLALRDEIALARYAVTAIGRTLALLDPVAAELMSWVSEMEARVAVASEAEARRWAAKAEEAEAEAADATQQATEARRAATSGGPHAENLRWAAAQFAAVAEAAAAEAKAAREAEAPLREELHRLASLGGAS
jgi:hypothetical protein